MYKILFSQCTIGAGRSCVLADAIQTLRIKKEGDTVKMEETKKCASINFFFNQLLDGDTMTFRLLMCVHA